tara:strand:- start:948 stop:1136 length:189 start_codon:yes stop_codon:yes gene_type:complete
MTVLKDNEVPIVIENGCYTHRMTEEDVADSWMKFSLLPELNTCACCAAAVLPQYVACTSCWD